MIREYWKILKVQKSYKEWNTCNSGFNSGEVVDISGIIENFSKFEVPQSTLYEVLENCLENGGIEREIGMVFKVGSDSDVFENFRDVIVSHLDSMLEDLRNGEEISFDEDFVNDMVEFIMENEYDWDLEVNE